MNKFLFSLLIFLSLPILSPAQGTDITPKEANAKGDEYYKKKDYTEAVKWYRKAAEQGHAFAINNIGVFYETGRGVKQDYLLAKEWYQKAVKKDPDYSTAKKNLADIEKKISESTSPSNDYAQNATVPTQPKTPPQPKAAPQQ